MIDWITNALLEFEEVEKYILTDPNYIYQQFADLRKRMNDIAQKLDEEKVRDFQTALRHLVDGQNSDIKEVRNDEFRMARTKFNELLSLDPNGTAITSGETIPNTLIIALSYWGNHHYFLLRGDKRNALIQVYESTMMFPNEGIQIYHNRFFSRDYRTMLENAYSGLNEATNYLQEANSNNSSEEFKYTLKQIGVHLGAGAVGLGAGAILSLLSFGPGMVGGAMAYKSIVQGTEDEIDKPILQNVNEGEQQKEKYAKQVKTIIEELHTECKSRRLELQRVSLKQMLQMRR